MLTHLISQKCNDGDPTQDDKQANGEVQKLAIYVDP